MGNNHKQATGYPLQLSSISDFEQRELDQRIDSMIEQGILPGIQDVNIPFGTLKGDGLFKLVCLTPVFDSLESPIVWR
jgi:hypothetical protein